MTAATCRQSHGCILHTTTPAMTPVATFLPSTALTGTVELEVSPPFVELVWLDDSDMLFVALVPVVEFDTLLMFFGLLPVVNCCQDDGTHKLPE